VRILKDHWHITEYPHGRHTDILDTQTFSAGRVP
jgi:hypothetical protein